MFKKLYILIILLIYIQSLYSQEVVNSLIAVVRVDKAKVRDRKISDDTYIVEYYHKGDIIDLEYCDQYDWCKVKDKELYVSKHILGVMLVVDTQKYTTEDSNVSIDLNNTSYNETILPFEPIKITELRCIRLKQIDLTENDILDKDKQDELFSAYYGKCFEAKMLKPLLSSISKYYIDKGFITTKPYLIEQDINDGQLDIAVSKGVVEDIIDANTSKSNWQIATAFISQKGKMLNLRDLETSLEVINRVPSVDAKFKIKPGSKQGGSIVSISKIESFPFHMQLGVSDEGNIEKGDAYLTANISYDNLLNINDILSFRLNGSAIQKSYQGNRAGELNYTFPIGSYFMELVYFQYTYDRAVAGNNNTYLSSGDTSGGTLKLNKILFRNQTNKLKATVSLQYKDTQNYFSKELIEVSSYATTQAQIDISHTFIQNWGQLINTYSFYAGTDWFGARNDNYFNSEVDQQSDAKLQFIKHTLDTNLYLSLFDRSYQLSSNLHIQYTNDFLYDNNKLSIGSYYTVRGYLSSLFGNIGMYQHNDLTKTFSPNLSTMFLQTISTFLGLDYGYIKCQKDNPNSCGDLVGSALGIKTNGKYLSSDFTFSRYLKKVSDVEDKYIFRYNLLFKF